MHQLGILESLEQRLSSIEEQLRVLIDRTDLAERPAVPDDAGLTVAQAAKRLGVSDTQVRSLIATKEIASFRVRGCLRVTISEVRRIMQGKSQREMP